MLQPLQQWYCDECFEVIEQATEGYVVWNSDEEGRNYGFKVIHKVKCDNHELPRSSALEDFLGADGQNKLLSMLSYGIIARLRSGCPTEQRIADIDSFVDLFRRMQVPYYEEARQRMLDPRNLDEWSGVNEIYPYQVFVLREVAAGKLDVVKK